MSNNKANVIEMFSSVQGEGPYVGYRQIFIRLAKCNMQCKYCDTDYKAKDSARIEQTPGMQDFELIENPVDVETLFYYIKKLNTFKGLHHSISITGGEPLLQSDFLKIFLTENHAKYKNKIYLETNGTLPEDLMKIVKLVDIISMDIKLPSSVKNITEYWHVHKRFLEIINAAKCSKVECFVKIVLDNNFTDYELLNIIWCLSSTESDVPLILQPETNNPPDSLKLLEWQERLARQINDVRIIPQTHKITSLI